MPDGLCIPCSETGMECAPYNMRELVHCVISLMVNCCFDGITYRTDGL
jgi:hypothetical protein